MPLFKTIPVNGGLIGVWELTEKPDDFLPEFTAEELADPAFQKYSYDKRKVEWLATRILLKQLIGPDFSISYSEHGKPTLNHPKFKHLSISHSREFASVFVHEYLNVGLDIENQNRNYRSIIKRYLSEAEIKEVGNNPLLHCLYWCAKEAIFKLVPEDGIEFKEQILISPFNPATETQFGARFISDNTETEYKLHFVNFSDQCMVWVTT